MESFSLVPIRRDRRRARVALAGAAAAGLIAALLTAEATAAVATTVGVIPDTDVPETLVSSLTGQGEVGLEFTTTASGVVSGVQFYQNASNAGVTSASVWSSTGQRLATVSVNPWSQIGWRTAPLNVRVEAGKTYTVSVYDSNGRPPLMEDEFLTAQTVDGLTVPAAAGVYRFASSSAFPSTETTMNFSVDVVFTADPPPVAPTPTPTPSASPTPIETATPLPEPEPEPEPEPTPTVAPAAPVSAPLYGPDGTHWPSSTPAPGSARVVNVAPTWSAIASAITANANTSDPVVICVAPGNLAGGNGAGSSSRGVLENIGNAQRASRILVSACSGVGTVKSVGDKGLAFVGVKGVSIVGIDFSGQSVMIRNSEAFALGYSVVPTLLVTANGGNGVRDVEIVEVVAGVEALAGATGDRVEVKSAGGYDVDGIRFAGFYAAPHYKVAGSTAHVDTIQFVTTSGDGLISDVVFEDAAVFMSSNQGIMAGGNTGGQISDSAFFGGTTGQLRYPVYAAGYQIIAANMLHGTWSSLTVEDSIVAGSVSPSYSFIGVENSRSTKGDRGFQVLGTVTLADIDRVAPKPTPQRLASIWGQ